MDGDEGARPLTAGLQASLDRIAERFEHRPQNDPATGGPAALIPPTITINDVVRSEERLADGGPRTDADLAYTPAVFAQLCLPYRNPGDVARWIRTNGLMTLTVRPGQWYDLKTGELREGFPFGVLPRLVVLWMATEAKKTKRRELLLGPSLTAFMSKLIIGRSPGRRSRPGGGPTGSFSRLGDQLRRMLSASVTILDRRPAGGLIGDRTAVFSFASESLLWWSPDAPADQPLWDSVVVLSEPFYEEIRSGSMPLPTDKLVDLRARTSSPLALDIYTWLAHRLHRVKTGAPSLIAWSELAMQFGGDYKHVRQFKAQFLKELAHVYAVYPTARVEPGPKGGLLLRRSPSPVEPKALGH